LNWFDNAKIQSPFSPSAAGFQIKLCSATGSMSSFDLQQGDVEFRLAGDDLGLKNCRPS